ncbi:MAG: hypothetical protein R3E97_17060 [Candidatus Eisenbacteria bacterium]
MRYVSLTRFVVSALSLSCLLATATEIRAQDVWSPPAVETRGPWTLAAGDRVRVRLEDGDWVEARFLEASGTEISVAPTSGVPETLSLPANSTHLQVQTGTQRHTGRGMLIGALVGFGAGYAIGAAHENDSWFEDLAGPAGATVGTTVGLFTGGIIGFCVRTPTWNDTYRYSVDSAAILPTKSAVEFDLVLFSR